MWRYGVRSFTAVDVNMADLWELFLSPNYGQDIRLPQDDKNENFYENKQQVQNTKNKVCIDLINLDTEQRHEIA